MLSPPETLRSSSPKCALASETLTIFTKVLASDVARVTISASYGGAVAATEALLQPNLFLTVLADHDAPRRSDSPAQLQAYHTDERTVRWR